MDRRVPPRVTYWTGIFEPAREALSREVEILRRRVAPPAPVVSFSSGQRSSLVRRDNVIRLSSRRWMVLRLLAAALERTGDITHVFGEIDCWHLLRAVGRRPVMLTVAIPGPLLDARDYRHVRAFVAETDALARALRVGGIDPHKIRVILPGVDLEYFKPVPAPEGRFRVLFASSPASPSHFGRRGIPLLVETARLCPDIDFVMLWRQWGSQSAADGALEALRPPGNVIVERGDVADIASAFQRAHATVLMAADGYGKSCPNSVIEGLACGRPALVSPSCGIADLLVSGGAGLTPTRDPRALEQALRALMINPEGWRERARSLAEHRFALSCFSRAYEEAYERLHTGETSDDQAHGEEVEALRNVEHVNQGIQSIRKASLT